jgi:hypothetical protein
MTSSVESAATVVQHSMNRIDISTGVEFEEFKSAFEKAAPPFDPATVRSVAARGMKSLRRRRSTRPMT